MEKLVINATRRTVIGKQVKALRREGKLPGVIYGHHIEATPITMDLRDATRVLAELTASSIVTINLDGVENAALVREKQRDFIKGMLRHVDFPEANENASIFGFWDKEKFDGFQEIKDFDNFVWNAVKMKNRTAKTSRTGHSFFAIVPARS